MTKYILLAFVGFLMFSGVDCRRNPVGPPPPNGTDTTSHNWTFTIDTLGDGSGGSYLNDVAIVSTNPPTVFAVGQVYKMDSAGQVSPTLYNMARWDGNGWVLESVPYHYQGQTYYHEWRAVFALTPNDLWIGGNGLLHWNGNQFSEVLPLNSIWGPHNIGKIWADSDNNIYLVGDGGTMAHFDGTSWQRIPTGTTEDIQDIWGGIDSTTGKEFALATVSTVYYGGYSRLLKITGTQADTVSTNGLSWSIRGVWFDSKSYYVVGAELYHKNTLQDSIWKILAAPGNSYINAIRGNASNDIIAVGGSQFLHFNGRTWYSHYTGIACTLYSVNIEGNLAVAVGTLGGEEAIAVIAKRK